LDRFEARKRIVADLEAAGLMEKIDPHKLMVPRGDRSHAVIEPFLTDQWYVSVQALADPAIKAVEDGDIKFVPENWSKTYFEWMRNIDDWCISRQLWWGHRIPAWYDEEGNVYVGGSEDEVRGKYGLEPTLVLRQDDDVLDTWFSSALWPFSTLGWPARTDELAALYPTSVLVTGFDIIFFWVARMIMMGLKFTGEVPFKEIYIHGLIRDSHGHKMSKSKGNVLDPIDLIDGIELEPLVAKRITGLMQPTMAPAIERHTRRDFPDGIPAFGTDALRFTFAALASHGRDINFDLGRIGGYRNFCNKLWNAARYVLMNTEGQDNGLDSTELDLSLADRWILSRFEHTRSRVVKHIADYRFDLASQAIYEFTWNEYCDWYLELSKPVLTSAAADAAVDSGGEPGNGFVASEAMQRGARRTLVRVLEELLRLIHPFMPFITEAIWQRAAPLAGKSGDTIMLQPYPAMDDTARNSGAEQEMAWVMAFIQGVRNIRGEMNLAPGKAIDVVVQGGDDSDRSRVERNRGWLMALARLSEVRWLEAGEEAPMASVALVGEMKVLVPMAGLIDTAAELKRLDKEIAKVEKNLSICAGKLANPRFVDNAPAEIVEQEQGRVREMTASLKGLREQRGVIAAMA
jgi:valyl-tRNA synthetase